MLLRRKFRYTYPCGRRGKRKKIENGLREIGIKPSELNGVLVTHEHIDHVKGLGIIARKYGVPIYATRGTIEGITANKTLGQIDEELYRTVSPDQVFEINDISVDPTAIWHDANDPVCYSMSMMGKRYPLQQIWEIMTII